MAELTEFVSGDERILLPDTEGNREMQRQIDKLQRVAWIHSLANWEVMSTGTFRWSASSDSARRIFERWMKRKLPRVSFFYALERNPSRDGYHVHSLWADCRGVFRKDAWQDWFNLYGRARIEPIRSAEDSESYASKYLCKEDGWWNVVLQWHWKQRLHNKEFVLQ